MVTVPPGVVTETSPDDPDATTAVMLVLESTVKDEAETPPKLTADASDKLVPVIVTDVPVKAVVGVKLVMVGAGINTKPGAVPEPPDVVTETAPLEPVATTAVIFVSESTVKEAALVPPKLTAVAPVKFAPISVTESPLIAEFGVKLVIVGAGIKTKSGLVAMPPVALTDT